MRNIWTKFWSRDWETETCIICGALVVKHSTPMEQHRAWHAERGEV
jgi:hypothetical protein